MKAKKKRKHLEKGGEKKEDEESREKNGGDDGQEQPCTAKKPRKIRFLVRLQKTWARMAGCMRRKTSSKEERRELPGPSNIHLMDSTEKGDNTEHKKIKEDKKEKVKNKVKEVGEIKNQEHGEEELEKAEKAKKCRNIKFLARLQKSWAKITDFKWRGTYIIKEKSSSSFKGEKKEDDEGEHNFFKTSGNMMEDCRSVKDFSNDSSSHELQKPKELSRSTTSQSSSCHEEKSDTKSHILLEKPVNSKETSSGTVPLSLESFTFYRALGQGGFGQVFLATDKIRKECVAIKVVDKRCFTKRRYSFVERNIFQRSHESPFLIHGLAAFHTLNFVYYVMEVATRGDLLFVIRNYPLDIAAIKFITAEVVCGTEFLHRKGILHRDLKLQNILLTREGHIKITDFGLTVTGVFVVTLEKCRGTPGYAAPEMARDLVYGRGVDFFGIGVIMYNMFTLKDPFPGKSPDKRIQSVFNHTPVYPKSLSPNTVNIMEGLLCKNQFQRLGVKEDIRKHPFFSDISWEDVEARRMAPPMILMAASIDLNVEETLDYAELPNRIQSKHQKIFNQFSFVCPEWSKQYHPVITQTKNWMAKLFTNISSRK